MPIKVLHLASGDLWAGAEVQLFHLAKKLDVMNEIELLVVLLNRGRLEEELRRYDVRVLVLDESVLSGVAVLKKLNKIVKEFQPDILHTHRTKENVIGGLVAKWNGIKSIRTTHGAPEFAKKLLNVRRIIFEGLDRLSGMLFQQKIVAVSDDLKRKLEKKFSPEDIVVIENCVDIDYIKSMSERASGISVDRGGFNVAFVGRFVPVKRVDLFYLVAKSVLSRPCVKPVHFHMIGDGPLKESFAANVKKDHMEAGVYLHGFVENVAPALRQMDLLVFTSDHEGLPMTLLEAMTLGVPVLSRDLPSIKKVLCDGKCGYIASLDVVSEFSKIILLLVNDEVSPTGKIKMARDAVYDRYNITANAEKYADLYKSVLVNP